MLLLQIGRALSLFFDIHSVLSHFLFQLLIGPDFLLVIAILEPHSNFIKLPHILSVTLLDTF